MTWKIEYPRLKAERKPAGHIPRAPRWILGFERPVSLLTSEYIGLQVKSLEEAEVREFLRLIKDSVHPANADGPLAHELLMHRDSEDLISVVFLGYWLESSSHARWWKSSPLGLWFKALDAGTIRFGAWHETIQVPMERFETVYSDPGRPFGLARCDGTLRIETTVNGYFGAARDRFPVSAIDSLDAEDPAPFASIQHYTFAKRLRVETGLNAVAIRSGQYWQEADTEQLNDYEVALRPKLMAGMNYLSSHAEEVNVQSLRVMTSLDPETLTPLRETSVLGYFSRLDSLENWAAHHATHASIYEHAIEKKRQYGDSRSVVTWHEVFALLPSMSYEYVNCHPNTGLLPTSTALYSTEE